MTSIHEATRNEFDEIVSEPLEGGSVKAVVVEFRNSRAIGGVVEYEHNATAFTELPDGVVFPTRLLVEAAHEIIKIISAQTKPVYAFCEQGNLRSYRVLSWGGFEFERDYENVEIWRWSSGFTTPL